MIERAATAVRAAAVPSVSVSVVVHRPDLPVLEQTLRSLRGALSAARRAGVVQREVAVHLIDNGSLDPAALDRSVEAACGGADWLRVRVARGHGNVGYGRGHNLGIAASAATYHLILNPDVTIEPDAVTEAVRFLEANPDVALVAPQVAGAAGERQYLCRRYPSLLVLCLRGFAPEALRRRFRRRLDEYEMRDVLQDAVVKGVPLASGCFMFARGRVLREVGGFSPRYFLYFEDHDLSLAVRRRGSIAFVPAVRITHHGGGAARKGLRHALLFARSGLTFFRRHGWRLW